MGTGGPGSATGAVAELPHCWMAEEQASKDEDEQEAFTLSTTKEFGHGPGRRIGQVTRIGDALARQSPSDSSLCRWDEELLGRLPRQLADRYLLRIRCIDLERWSLELRASALEAELPQEDECGDVNCPERRSGRAHRPWGTAFTLALPVLACFGPGCLRAEVGHLTMGGSSQRYPRASLPCEPRAPPTPECVKALESTEREIDSQERQAIHEILHYQTMVTAMGDWFALAQTQWPQLECLKETHVSYRDATARLNATLFRDHARASLFRRELRVLRRRRIDLDKATNADCTE